MGTFAANLETSLKILGYWGSKMVNIKPICSGFFQLLKAIKLHVRIKKLFRIFIKLILLGLRSMEDLESLSIVLESRNEYRLRFDWYTILEVTWI